MLNAVQLLWISLLVDTFAAFALATVPLTLETLDRKPDRKPSRLITLTMAKMIVWQVACQTVITLVLYFKGNSLLGYHMGDEGEEARMKTVVFNTFVWLQIFNLVK